MGCITDSMTGHHRHCDGALRRTEEAAAGLDWAAVEREARRFLREIERHIEIEEDVLFPAFEQATGTTRGPTGVMRMEHARLREGFAQMRAAIAAKDAPKYRDSSAGLIALLQQHNLKEEGILYPMLDRALGDAAHGLLEKAETLIA